MQQKILLNKVKKLILSLGKALKEVGAIGICGSLARGTDFNSRSDIDIFIVMKGRIKERTELHWHERIKEALKDLNREITILVYSLNGLKQISNWYVLRLASEGILIFDKGNVKKIFQEIITKAKNEGLIEEHLHNLKFWSRKEERFGEPLEISL